MYKNYNQCHFKYSPTCLLPVSWGPTCSCLVRWSLLIPKVKKKAKMAFCIFLQANFSSTLNVMILQTTRNECVRFVGHVDLEVI
jgi:hypothetical protein